jgi:hypothetical protein
MGKNQLPRMFIYIKLLGKKVDFFKMQAATVDKLQAIAAAAVDERSYLRHMRGEVPASDHHFLFTSRSWYKLLHADRRHNGVTYEEGLNVDPVPFNPTGSCQPGGLYFTHFDYIVYWWRSLDNCSHIAEVTVPPDARVYIEPCGMKLKADKIELSNIRPLGEFLDTLDEITLECMVKAAPGLLEYIQKQTEAMCLRAVVLNGRALQYVRNPTDAMRTEALQQERRTEAFNRAFNPVYGRNNPQEQQRLQMHWFD